MRLSKKLAIAAVSTVAAVGVATSAFAFWTTSGGGSGSGSVAASNGSVGLSGLIAPGIYPGGQVAVSFKATNAGPDAVAVGSISAVITTPAVPDCAAYLHMLPVISGQNIPAHTTVGVDLTAGGTLTMDNADVNQDACKGTAISLALSSSPLPVGP